MISAHHEPHGISTLLDRPAYTTLELCRLASVTPRTLNNWRRIHGLPFITLPGGAIRYPAGAVDAWLRARGTGLTPHQRYQQTANKEGRAV